MRLDTAARKAKQRELRLRQQVEAPLSATGQRSEQRVSYYKDAEECGHLAHVTKIVNGRCPRCVDLTVRDGNGNLVS